MPGIESKKKVKESGNEDKKKVFIVSPWEREKAEKEFLWYSGEVQFIKVTVDYPLEFGINFEVSAIIQGIKAICYTTTVLLERQKSLKTFELRVKPMEEGILFVRGLRTSFCDLICDHYVSPNGIGIYTIGEESKTKERICEINVVKNIPRIVVQLECAQLLNGTLLGLKNERCTIKVHIKNISELSMQLTELKLFVFSRKVKKAELIAERDLIKEFGESPIHGRWYNINQVISITEKVDTCIFEFHYSSNSDRELIDKYEVPITVEDPLNKEKVVLPSLICNKWDLVPSIECPDIMEEVKKLLEKVSQTFICCSDHMTLVVELMNLCPYPFLVTLSHYDQVIAEAEIGVRTKKNFAAEIPYEVNITDNVHLKWSIPDLQRSGQDLIKNFLADQKQVLQALPFPVRIGLEAENAVKDTIIKGKVENKVKVTMTIVNIDNKTLTNLKSTIKIFKCTASSYFLINEDFNAIAISGELTHYIYELKTGETYNHTISILFTKRNVYRIGAVCIHEKDKVTVYVGNKGLTFETF